MLEDKIGKYMKISINNSYNRLLSISEILHKIDLIAYPYISDDIELKMKDIALKLKELEEDKIYELVIKDIEEMKEYQRNFLKDSKIKNY